MTSKTVNDLNKYCITTQRCWCNTCDPFARETKGIKLGLPEVKINELGYGNSI